MPRARSSRWVKPRWRRATTTLRVRRSPSFETLNFRLNLRLRRARVSRPNEHEQFLKRVRTANRSARNYYLIVEAIRADRAGGGALRVAGHERRRPAYTHGFVRRGLRVDRGHLQARRSRQAATTASFKNNVVGRKRRGVLEREYTVPTTLGAAVAGGTAGGKAMSLVATTFWL